MNTIKIEKGNVKMVAHRGLSGIEKENTHAAFVAAGNRSHWGIETDIHRTCDGHYIVSHDQNIKRVSGADINIENTTYDNLRQIKLYDRDGEQRRNDLCLPDLEEYLHICKRYEKHCVLELKSEFTDEEIAEIINIIKEYEWLEQVVFISFKYENLKKIRAILPNQPCQWLTGKPVSDEKIAKLAQDHLGLDIEYHLASKELIDKVHAIGQEFNVWICNDPQAAEQLVAWGADYITGDILE